MSSLDHLRNRLKTTRTTLLKALYATTYPKFGLKNDADIKALVQSGFYTYVHNRAIAGEA